MTAPASVHAASPVGDDLGASSRSLLEGRTYATIATENPDGTPHVAPVMFLYEDGRLLVETGSATRKARNVGERARATVLVQDPSPEWVSGSGPAAVLTGAEAAACNRRIRAKYLTAAGEQACGDVLAMVDDVTIAVTPTRWLTWDAGALLQAVAEHGADPAEAGSWFLVD